MYGSGAPLWGNGESLSAPANKHGGADGSGGGSYKSYQDSGAVDSRLPRQGNAYMYRAPTLEGGTYQEQQSHLVEDSLKTNYEAEGTAAAVLSQMTTQRYQLKAAHDDVWEMREATEKAKRELADMHAKSRKKKQRLQMIIAVLAVTDTFLLLRLLRCGGSFFCG
eukprot:CAMPEP_0196813750 /NCGR_PEP_ID=MMETSP1362-20130617/38843_1 /TAXON_ID=163516 /ORGANISM="Leptocylindrus danicus, Strain CCMP1856" /LENGTH=164 /DNA_ID=CAMNT_0042190111 /DNA_START=9 /DNA_END=503 /DNA_ORIENTATION=+